MYERKMRTRNRGSRPLDARRVGMVLVALCGVGCETAGPGDGTAQTGTHTGPQVTGTTGATNIPQGTTGNASAVPSNHDGGGPDSGSNPDASHSDPGDSGTSAPDATIAEGGTDASGDADKDEDLCDVGRDDGSPAPAPLTLSGNTFAHDPTMIEADGVFYRFWTGDYIPVATSTDLMHWRNADPVYRSGYPDWSNDWLGSIPGQEFNFPWAPDVSSFGGRYHLYSSFSAVFGQNISCITHLTTTDIASGNWTDHGPVICTDGSQPYNAIDADVGFDEEGKPWLSFGSFWDGIMIFPLDENGDRVGTELTRIAANRDSIEAPVLLRRCGFYYLFVSFGLCCPGEGRSVNQLSYRVAVGRSRSITGPYVDRNGVSLVEGGGSVILEGDGTFAAAGHSDVLVSDDAIYHLYHAYRRPTGAAELRIVEMRFDDEGWPVPAGP